MLTARIVRHPRRALLGALAFLLVAVVLGGPVFGVLDDGDGFVARDAESTRAVEAVERASGTQATPAVVALVESDDDVGSPAARRQVREMARELRAVPGVVSVDGARGAPISSTDGRTAYLAARLAADADEDAIVSALEERFADAPALTLGGSLLADEQLGAQISEDLGRAETFAFPLLLVLSFLFFRGWRAAALPLVVGVVTVFGTYLAARNQKRYAYTRCSRCRHQLKLDNQQATRLGHDLVDSLQGSNPLKTRVAVRARESLYRTGE